MHFPATKVTHQRYTVVRHYTFTNERPSRYFIYLFVFEGCLARPSINAAPFGDVQGDSSDVRVELVSLGFICETLRDEP